MIPFGINKYFNKKTQSKSVFLRYDDKTIFDSTDSMLIYEWTPYSSSSLFRIPDGKKFLWIEKFFLSF